MRKRLLSLALALCMSFSIAVPAFADTVESTGPDGILSEEDTTIETPTEEVSLFETAEFKENMAFLISLNTARIKKGISPLAFSEDLFKAATIRAKELETLWSSKRPEKEEVPADTTTPGTSDSTEAPNTTETPSTTETTTETKTTKKPEYWSSVLYEVGAVTSKDALKSYSSGFEMKGAGTANQNNMYTEWMSDNSNTLYLNTLTLMGLAHTDGTTTISEKEYKNPWSLILLGKYTTFNLELANLSEEPYPAGLSITDMGIVLKLSVRSPEGIESESYLPLISSMCKGYDSSKSGTQTVTVTYSDTFADPKEELSFTFDLKTKKAKKPAKPENFSATGTSYNKVTVNWSPVEDAKAYEIYRSTKEKKDYKKIVTLKPRNMVLNEDGQYTYIDKDRTSGVKYYYKMRATNGSVASSYTAIDPAKPNIDAPKNLKVSSRTKKTIKVKWSKVDKASNYRVYYSTKKNGKYRRATKPSTKKNYYTISKLKKGKTYYIKVLAYKDGRPSSYSDIIKVKTKK